MDYTKDRKSIDEILEFLKTMRWTGTSHTQEQFEKYLHDYAERLQAALNRDRAVRNAANKRKPRRNCDVGTEHEQHQRFTAFCDAYNVVSCTKCPAYRSSSCELAWGQMPYEDEQK